MYLMSRGQVFWFSRNIKQLAGHFIHLASDSHVVGNNGYLRFSLKTGNRREAERLARRFAVEVDDALERLEHAKKVSAQPISPKDIQIGAATMLTDLLAADESTHKAALEAALSGNDVERFPDRERGLADDLPPPGVAGDAELLRNLRSMIPFYLLQSTGKIPRGTVDSSYLPFAAAFRQAVESLSQRAEGKSIPTPPMPQDPTACGTCTWDSLMEYYLKHHDKLAESTVALYGKAIRDLAAFAKCLPVEISRAQVVGWRDQLITLVKSKTALTRLNAAHTVYNYSLQNEQMGERRDPFTGVTVTGAKNAKSSRQEYTLEALKKVFRDPPALASIPASAGKHAALWVPLIALFTGARKEEIASLLMDEVIDLVFGDLIYVHFKDNKLRKLKKDSCERRIPMHSELIRLGFKEYVGVIRASGAERLFPGVVCSDSVTDWFVPHVKSRIGETGFKQDIHSFRHTFKTAARNVPLDQEIHDAITGHKTQGVGGDYGSIAGVKTLKREIDKVTFPDVILSPPPVPTVDEIRALMADAERRRVAGQRRRRKISSELS